MDFSKFLRFLANEAVRLRFVWSHQGKNRVVWVGTKTSPDLQHGTKTHAVTGALYGEKQFFCGFFRKRETKINSKQPYCGFALSIFSKVATCIVFITDIIISGSKYLSFVSSFSRFLAVKSTLVVPNSRQILTL